MAGTSLVSNTVVDAITASVAASSNAFNVPVGDFYKDSRLQTFIRPQNVDIIAFGMRPNSQIFVYFDGQRVDQQFVQPAMLPSASVGGGLVATGALGAALTANADGSFYAIFNFPQGVFLTGSRQLMLSDSDFISALTAETTYASTVFNAFNANSVTVASAPSPTTILPAANTSSIPSQIVNLLGVTSLTVEYSSNVLNPDIWSTALALKWDGKSAVNLNVVVDSGVVIGSANTSAPALKIPQFPTGSHITIINNGYISGAGGYGGQCGAPTPSAGGPALQLLNQATIVNAGVIQGGGGGGGSGNGNNGYRETGGGGGGAGSVPGKGGPGRPFVNSGGWGGAYAGTDGTLTAGGPGGPSAGVGAGGDGGAPGQAGKDSNVAGGAAGTAIQGYAKALLSGPGTVLGPLVN